MAQPGESLIGEGDPAPVRVLRPAGASEFFLTADHAGRAIPRRLGTLGLLESELQRHIAWDIGIAGVTEKLADALGATAILQAYSRLVIDCNREPLWATSIPEISELTAIPGNAAIPPAEREARRREIFQPYHERIAAILDARAAVGRRTVLIAMHSFTPVFKGEPRNIEVGVLYNKDARLAHILRDLLAAEGDLKVGDNAPYAITEVSDYTVPVHGERRVLPHVEIEIRQDLIGDEPRQAAWAARLARLLPIADAKLREQPLSRTAGEGCEQSEPGEGVWAAPPSPSHAHGVGPSLSRNAGEGPFKSASHAYSAASLAASGSMPRARL